MSDSTTRYGQRVLRELGINEVFWEREEEYDGPETARVVASQGDPGVEIQPIDRDAAKVTSIDLAATQALLDAISRTTYGSIDYLRLPDSLISITGHFDKSAAEGFDEMPADQQVAESLDPTFLGSAVSNPSASAQGSGAVTADVFIEIEENNAENVPTSIATFYLAENSTRAAILAKAATVLGASISAWPRWGAKQHTVLCTSQRVSVQVNAKTRLELSGTVKTYQWGGGSSWDLDVNTKAIRIPPTIHPTITISTTTDTQNVEATADASTPELFTGLGFLETDAIPNVVTNDMDAVGTISLLSGGATIAATTIQTIPTSGLYLVRITSGDTIYGRTMYQVVAIDFADV